MKHKISKSILNASKFNMLKDTQSPNSIPRIKIIQQKEIIYDERQPHILIGIDSSLLLSHFTFFSSSPSKLF